MNTAQKLPLRHLFSSHCPSLNAFEVLVTQHIGLQWRGGNYGQLLQPTGGFEQIFHLYL